MIVEQESGRWYASCACGWCGKPRMFRDTAQRDYEEHMAAKRAKEYRRAAEKARVRAEQITRER